ncbi:hypothetical protein VA599_16770 [Chromobacterium sp. TRC.1.1.SA]|uniref:DUF4365 domain-containing protein n=1 Tax=Chromobacterium indicum TaxID=3110228 RepID=A0ABV0CPS8_9NEIS
MPINSHNCESFYQGSFAEHHICSLFYLYGYEAQKVSPDVGIDFMVTNLARVRFRGEAPLHAEVQVKSVLLDANGAYACLSLEELEYLSTGEDRYCVFVILYGLKGGADPRSFEREDADANKAVDRDIVNYLEDQAAENGRSLRREGVLSIHDFNHVEVQSFWLHSSQMKKLRSEGMWKQNTYGSFGLQISLENELVFVEDIQLIPELKEVRYIVEPCCASNKIRSGALSMEDY